ncbi:MAG TPA: hypothetical protein VE085_10695 [Burkholderiales bacterium]|nr:hypothetical protein [Burkholderiales bacterium]
MPSDPLRNLVAARKLKAEPPDRQEFDNLMTAGRARRMDAQRHELAWESRFDLAYSAAHAFALAALRRLGYRSDNRLGIGAGGDWRVLALAHERRNRMEYSGEYEIDERLLSEVIQAAELIAAKLAEVGPPE